LKVFLPCFNTFIDGLDVNSSNYTETFSFFTKMVTERQKYPSYTMAFFPPSFQKKIIDIIVEVLDEEWSELSQEDIEKKAEVINKVMSATDLGGEHLSEKLSISIALFELALYLDDEHDVYIVTNDEEKLEEKRKKWIEFRKDKKPSEKDFVVINPAQAIYLMKSSK